MPPSIRRVGSVCSPSVWPRPISSLVCRNDVDRSRKVLDASVALFDRQLVEPRILRHRRKSRTPTSNLKNPGWPTRMCSSAPYPAHPTGPRYCNYPRKSWPRPSGDGATREVVRDHHRRLVNIAGRQRMLSQRLAKFLSGFRLGVGGSNATAEIDKAKKDFVAAHQELSSSAANTAPIKDGLALRTNNGYFSTLRSARSQTRRRPR